MEKGIKPSGVLLFLLCVFTLLLLISVVFPPGGIRVGPDMYLYFPGVRDILDPADPGYADVSHLEDHMDKLEESLVPGYPVPAVTESEAGMPYGDSLFREKDSDATCHYAADEGALRTLIYPVQYPAGTDTLLYGFFRALENRGNNELIRIIHYGDSQLENDRISSVLRNRFQIRFGGSGIGMFPVLSAVPHTASLRIRPVGNWKRHTPLGRPDPGSIHNRYGLLLSYSQLVPSDGDSVIRGSLTVRPAATGYRRSREMKELSVFFGSGKEPFTIGLSASGETLASKIVAADNSTGKISWTLPAGANEFSLILTGKGSADIYAVSIDDASGVAVDNVPLRGSRGLEFSRTDPAVMKQMIEDHGTRLVLLQFGLNIVPHIVDDYTFFENSLYRELRFIKSLSPDINILVVGVSDMSARTAGGYYESYPNIELIRDAQRNAAFRAGVPFWDLYEAMGGKNSMPAWVSASPPLGQPDYTHFSYRGSILVGDLLFNAIMEEYDRYLRGEAEMIIH